MSSGVKPCHQGRACRTNGKPGPDGGKGGKFLILPSDYDKPVPDGYYVSRSELSLNFGDGLAGQAAAVMG